MDGRDIDVNSYASLICLLICFYFIWTLKPYYWITAVFKQKKIRTKTWFVWKLLCKIKLHCSCLQKSMCHHIKKGLLYHNYFCFAQYENSILFLLLKIFLFNTRNKCFYLYQASFTDNCITMKVISYKTWQSDLHAKNKITST